MLKFKKIINVQAKVIIAFLVGLIITSTNAYAYADENNVTVNVTCDKESYSEGENISLNVEVINNSQKDIKDVNVKCIAPNEVTLLRGDVNLGNINASKHSNAQISLMGYPNGDKGIEERQTTITPKENNNSNTADGLNIIPLALVVVSATTVIIVFRKNKKVLSCMIIGIMFCSVLNGVNANASETPKIIDLDKTILVDGKEISVSFKVTYKIDEDADQANPENPAEIATETPSVATETPGTATETPVSPTDNRCKEKIVNYNISGNEFNNKVIVVKSAQELKDTLAKYMGNYQEFAEKYNSDLIKEYDESYFENNNLVLYPHERWDGDTSEISDITIENNVITLNLIHNYYYSEDGAYPKIIEGKLLLGELSKSEFNDDTTVLVNEIKQLNGKYKQKIVRYDILGDEFNNKVIVVKSEQELKDILAKYIENNQQFAEQYNNDLIKEYDDLYFKYNNLILYPHERCCGDTSETGDIAKENNTIILNLIHRHYYTEDGLYPDVIEGKLLIEELPKTEFNDDTTVLVNEIEKIRYIQGTSYTIKSHTEHTNIDHDLDRDAQIIKSVDELQKYNILCNNKLSKNYDDGFFKEKSLIVLPLVEGSSSIEHKIEQLSSEYNPYTKIKKIDISLNSISPEVVTCDMAEDFIVIEIDKDIVDDADEIEIVEMHAN